MVVGRSDDEGLTEKLREIASQIEEEMEGRLEVRLVRLMYVVQVLHSLKISFGHGSHLLKGRGSHLQTIPIIMNFGMDEKYTVMIICMKSQKCTLKNF